MSLILRQLLMTWLPLLLFVGCAVVVPWYCYRTGLEHGRLEVTAQTDKQTIASLNELMSNHREMIESANTASNRILTLTSQRQAYDEITTKTLQEVLDETAALRAACVYDADVMRQLEDARQRAAAAAASGFDGAVSSPDRAGQ
ncbi:hypothetical protein Q7C_825 [Methylophaga frappieri]|uniref:Uncharacterized protein n=1 Tax=Methylophaga frappieri (strain ATCC BAA-2434 / DSM 25690 / JAM7) TaxID=754477 RepID=I1YGF1_METFJ|nr:hypothetical protein [Methylophaga frappieri]AFJ01994.1 hypothetical protein Q7C_825 [Methylophaga frappieri]